jgi:hypothetical protein
MRQLLRISSESVKKMALAQRKKAFWRRAEKNEKTPSRLGALKGFSVASAFLAFRAQRWRLSVPFFAKKEERNKKIPATQVHHPNGRNYSRLSAHAISQPSYCHVTWPLHTPREATPPD